MKTLWIFVCCFCLLSAANERRRRIKKKIIKSPEEVGVGVTEPETADNNNKNNDAKPKEPRGWVDIITEISSLETMLSSVISMISGDI